MKKIRVSCHDNILNIVLHRPESHNALDKQMILELKESFSMPLLDKKIRAVVLRGDGKSFCSGADLDYMRSMSNFSQEENEQDAEQLFTMFDTGLKCPVPLIVYAQGNVMGGGLGLVAVADYVVAEASTQFCFSEVRVGLIPAVISPFILRKMRWSGAIEKILRGRRFSAEEALQDGLVHYVGSAEDCSQDLERILRDIQNSGPEAVRESKALLRFLAEPQDWMTIKDRTTQAIAERRKSVEGQEGMSAFFEKRRPNWS